MAFANKRFLFATLATLVLATKVIHIHANSKALAQKYLVLWGYTFFAQDLALLSLFHFLFTSSLFTPLRKQLCLWTLASWLIDLLAVYTALISFSGICFFIFNGSEIHYRNLDFAKDASARALLLSGLLSATLIATGILAFSWAAQSLIYFIFGLPADSLELGWSLLRSRVLRKRFLTSEESAKDALLLPTSTASDEPSTEIRWLRRDRSIQYSWRRIGWYLACVGAIAAALVEVALLIFRPSESSLIYLSWTAPFLPFVDFDNSSPSLARLTPIYNSGIGRSWDNLTALATPPKFSWLPKATKLSGFEDWYGDDKQHYSAATDPLKTDDPIKELLPGLREHLKDVKIQHVVLLMLESTRKDLFPVKKDGLIWNRFAETYPDGKLSKQAADRLANLTPTANYLTGDHNDGFGHGSNSASRGGLSFTNAYTSGTFTLKSTVGTICGVHPLVADFNLEYQHHIYQPCLPHILDVFNAIEDGTKGGSASAKWRSSFMQSITVEYDNTGPLLRAMGFPQNRTITKEYLKKPSAKFGTVTLPDINYFGLAEYPLLDYIRDTFAMARKDNERVFLSHITSTSHHPYNMPSNETYTPLGFNGALSDMSHYVNAVGYDDHWLRQILDVLDQEEVAQNTLVVVHGDHGISIPENDILASYYNPNVGCDHVPLVFSHPRLPPFQIDTAVSTMQILPTILDLLVETRSLSKKSRNAAQDLIRNFEGVSLLRTSKEKHQDTTNNYKTLHNRNKSKWQFVVMNPGRAMVGVRHADHKDWRLVVPILANIPWRFTNIFEDPREEHPLVTFEFKHFLAHIEEKYGLDAAKWAEEAAFIARWWVEENSKRWQYGSYASSSTLA